MNIFAGLKIKVLKWPDLSEPLEVGDIVRDPVKHHGKRFGQLQRGKIIEVLGEDHYKVQWLNVQPGLIEEYNWEESVWLEKMERQNGKKSLNATDI